MKCCTSETIEPTPTEYGRSVARLAFAELAELPPLEEREIVPLARVPGWYAYRGPDRDHGGAVEEIVLFMKANVVERLIGRLPESREHLPVALEN